MKYLLPFLLICGQALACDCLEKIENIKYVKISILASFYDTTSQRNVIEEEKIIIQIKTLEELLENMKN